MSDNTLSSFAAMLKLKYAPLIPDIIKLHTKLVSMIPFEVGEANPGKGLVFPIMPAWDHGIHFNSDGTAFQLDDPGPISIPSVDAIVDSTTMVGRSVFSYDVLTRAASNKETYDPRLMKHVNLAVKSLGRNLELSMLYGQTGLGTASSATFSGTSGTIVISAATWAPGLWVGMEGAKMDLWSSSAVGATQYNTNAAITVVSVNQSTRTITFSCNSADATSLDGGDTGVLYRRGSRTSSAFREFAGLDKIFSNTGVLFGIDANQYQIWKGNTVDCNSQALTMGAIQQGIVNAATIGGLEDDCTLLLSPKTWASVMDDMNALRVFDSSYKDSKLEMGSKSIEFYSMTGKIEFVTHPYIKEGEAYAFPKSVLKRVGTSECKFWEIAGGKGDEFLMNLQNQAGVELRTYCNQGLYSTHPARLVKFTNIVNPTL